MTENLKCPTCGTALPPSGHCPKCLIGLGLAAELTTSSSDNASAQRGPRGFAGYELKRQIGCGAMGVVYEAVEIGLNRTVALKLILDAHACSPVARRRFLIESEAAARLDHPNIVPIYHVGEHEDQPFISMKLIHGETLQAKMGRGEFLPTKAGGAATKTTPAARQKTVARLVATLARAVHHAHTHNVVHRDLKPGNILIDMEGNPQLTDFGLAKILDDQHVTLTEPGTIQGTVPYMPPEQVRGQKVSPAADTYSLGVILYELLTGQCPFRGNTPLETMKLIETQPPARPRSLDKHIHPDLETICLGCLEKYPGNRYGSTADLAEDLESWLHNQPIKKRPAGPLLRMGRWTKRNPLGAGLIVSLTLALFATAAFLITLGEKNRENVRNLQREKDIRASIIRDWTKRTDEMWTNEYVTNMVITAEQIALFRDRPLSKAENPLRLTYALNLDLNPVAVIEGFAPVLEHLSDEMSNTLGRPVLFDLRLVKNYFRFVEVASGAAHFQSMGAINFLRAREMSASVEPVVQELVGKEGVIVVRSTSPISTLRDLVGHSIGFPDTNSTLGLWGKVTLVEGGVWAKNLSFCETIGDWVPIPGSATGRDAGHDSAEHAGSPWGPSPGSGSGVAAAYRVRLGSLFDLDDFRKPPYFIDKLRGRGDAVSRFLWDQLSPKTQQRMLTNSDPTSPIVLDAVARDLNRILPNALYDPQRFPGITLSPETRVLQAQNPQGEDLIRFNRLWLQDAYPRELPKRREIDGAVLRERNWEKMGGANSGLRVIARFSSTPNLIATSGQLDRTVLRAFQDAMLALNNREELLTKSAQSWAGGLQKPDLRGLELVRQAMTNEAAQFDGLAPAPAPSAPRRQESNPSPK